MKTLISTLFLGAGLVLGLNGCKNINSKDPSHYKYIGKIGQDSVIFTRLNMYGDYSNLRVIKPDGREIEYEDEIVDDLKISEVSITKNGEREEYTVDYFITKNGDFINGYYGKPVLKKAQEQFDNYLHKIDSIKKTKGYKDKDYQKNISNQTFKNPQDSVINQALKDLD